MELKVGDRVRGGKYTGTVYSVGCFGATIKRDDGENGGGDSIEGYGNGWRVDKKDDGSWGDDGGQGSLIKLNDSAEVKKDGTIMSKLNSMMKRLLDKDTQALVKAGLINGDLLLTDEGKTELIAIQFEQNKAQLVARANEIIKEAKEK